MGKTFRMITAERVAMLMFATVLAVWGVIELCANKHVPSVPETTSDTVLIEKPDTVIPATQKKTKGKKEKKKSTAKKSPSKSPTQREERDYFDDQLNE